MSGVSLATIDVGSLVTGVGTLARDIRAAITGKEVIDANKAAEIELQLIALETGARNAQSEINKIEAASNNLFFAGWRPAAGWTCVFGFAYNYVLSPFLVFAVGLFVDTAPAMPELDMISLGTLLLGMLGLGGLRTIEKAKQVSREI